MLLEWDGAALLWVQEVLRRPWLDTIMSIYTQLGNVGMLWIVLSLLMLTRKNLRRAGVLSLMAMIVGFLCTNVALKHLVGRTRPWLVIAELVPLVEEGDPNSFPSGHTCAAFASAGAWLRTLPRKWMGYLALGGATVMGFSRIYVGVHYPSDVIVGALVGLFSAWIAWRLMLRYQRNKLQ